MTLTNWYVLNVFIGTENLIEDNQVLGDDVIKALAPVIFKALNVTSFLVDGVILQPVMAPSPLTIRVRVSDGIVIAKVSKEN